MSAALLTKRQAILPGSLQLSPKRRCKIRHFCLQISGICTCKKQAAHVAIVMLRYMILSVFQRQDEHHRALGELFFVMLTELEDITFNHSMMILVEAMLQTVKSIFRITDEQLEAFAVEFYSRLPEYMQKSLSYTQSRGSEAICHG